MTRWQQEMKALSKRGKLDARKIVNWARDNPQSALHKKFEWNDTIAAEDHRVDQARYLIRKWEASVTMKNGERVKTRAFVSLSKRRGKQIFYSIEAVLRDPEKRQEALNDAITELRAFRKKYKVLKELAGVFTEIDKL